MIEGQRPRLEFVPAELTPLQLYHLVEIAAGSDYDAKRFAVWLLEQQAQQGRYAREVLAVAGAIPIGIVTKTYLVEDPVTAPAGYKVGDIIEYREPVPFG